MSSPARLGALAITIALGLGLAKPARADIDLISPGVFSGQFDARLAGASGETSWTAGGFGKTRVSGAGGDVNDQVLGDAALVWRPRLTWDLGAVVEAEAQSGERSGIGEAYLAYKPVPRSDFSYSARAGLFYPPISLENEGAAWTVTNTITPSAINSWVGEEVKVVAAEASTRQNFGERSLGLTLAVFGENDTSGTLLALRGWSLDDIRANAFSQFKLPPLGYFLETRQAPFTTPVADIDNRLGVYGRADVRVSDALALDVFYYNNNGDRTTRRADSQWAWSDRFWDLGAVWDVDPDTRVLSQFMTGETQMGRVDPERWVIVDFVAGYLLATRKIGQDAVTGRVDVFETSDNNYDDVGSLSEHGWALTADYRHHLGDHAELLFEALHVESHRPGLAQLTNQDPDQSQTVLQAALRLSF